MILKILSYNMHKGLSALSRDVLTEMRDAIRSTQADVVFLQEVRGSEKQFEFLADQVWHHFAYGKNAVYPSGDHGNAILSKYPIEFWHNEDLTLHRFEQRGLLYVRVRNPETDLTLHLLNTHLNLREKDRRIQIARIEGFLRAHFPQGTPLILAGDFNDWLNSCASRLKEELALIESHTQVYGKPARSYPSIFPLLPLDRVYIRGFDIQSVEVLCRGPWAQLSDHAALCVTVRIP